MEGGGVSVSEFEGLREPCDPVVAGPVGEELRGELFDVPDPKVEERDTESAVRVEGPDPEVFDAEVDEDEVGTKPELGETVEMDNEFVASLVTLGNEPEVTKGTDGSDMIPDDT